MVKRETKHCVGNLVGVHLEGDKVRIWGATFEDQLNAPLADLGELVDSLRGLPESDGALLQEIERTKQRLRDLGEELARRIDAHADELKELR